MYKISLSFLIGFLLFSCKSKAPLPLSPPPIRTKPQVQIINPPAFPRLVGEHKCEDFYKALDTLINKDFRQSTVYRLDTILPYYKDCILQMDYYEICDKFLKYDRVTAKQHFNKEDHIKQGRYSLMGAINIKPHPNKSLRTDEQLNQWAGQSRYFHLDFVFDTLDYHTKDFSVRISNDGDMMRK